MSAPQPIPHGCETGDLFEGRCFACALLEVRKILVRLRLEEERPSRPRACTWAGA